jgi:hypothetical protein
MAGYSSHIGGFQRAHILDLLQADPFRPFEVRLVGARSGWRIDDPSLVSLAPYGEVVVIKGDGGREDRVALSAVACITVFGGDGS